MARSGVGRSATPIAGLLAVVLVFGPGRPYELPEHYRVELEVPPVDAALWFVARYPQYFNSGEAGLEAWLDGLDARDRVFVLAMAQTLTWAWVEHELAGLDEQDLQGLTLETITVIRHKTLNQLELAVHHHPELEGVEFDADLQDSRFRSGVFARLVRGISNCEGQNHLLAVLLGAALEPRAAWEPSIEVEMSGVDGHDLVRLTGLLLDQPVYVDAWSNLPPFTVDPTQPRAVPSLAELEQPPRPVIPGLAGREPHPAEEYTRHPGRSIELLPGREAPTKRVSLKVRAPRLDEASLARIKDPWRLYLFARVLHVYDDPRAAGLYQFVLEHHCEDRRPPRPFVCVASETLLERL
ncbi:MAG: hypothetical protein R6X02_35795 [Enhygromyxa sp.]